MPWVHEDLTTEAEVQKHFPKADRYEGTDDGFKKFRERTKWYSYKEYNDTGFSNKKGAAAWRLEDNGRVKMYSKSAGPYSAGRAFTRDALTWFGDGMIQMSLPYHSGSHNAHERMVPKGDDDNHKIGVAIQFWVSDNPKECVRFFLGWFRPVRKWNQGGFWKTLLVKTGSNLIGNINSMIQTTIQTSQKEITDLQKKHDKDIADKDEKIKYLTDQVSNLSTETKKLKGKNKRLRGTLDETKRELDAKNTKIKENNREIQLLQVRHDEVLSEYNALKADQDEEDVPLSAKKMEKNMKEMKKELKRLQSDNNKLKGELNVEKCHHQDTKNQKRRVEVQVKYDLPYLPSLPECERLTNSK